MSEIQVVVARTEHRRYAETICQMMFEAAQVRGTGIAKRKPEYLERKIAEGKAIIALDGERVAGFCYIEDWENQKFVANSGLIVHPDYRQRGLAKRIKTEIFRLSKQRYPNAKIFGITTSRAVMKINSELGYQPVTFSELTQDETFWRGCRGCVNYDILTRTERKMCLCTGMVADLAQVPQNATGLAQPEAPTPAKTPWSRFLEFIERRRQRISNLLRSKEPV